MQRLRDFLYRQLLFATSAVLNAFWIPFMYVAIDRWILDSWLIGLPGFIFALFLFSAMRDDTTHTNVRSYVLFILGCIAGALIYMHLGDAYEYRVTNQRTALRLHKRTGMIDYSDGHRWTNALPTHTPTTDH